MFKAKASLKEGFETTVLSTNSNTYKLYFEKGKDGPMDLFAVAFSGCILMCAKGYFARTFNRKDVEIDIDLDVDYENKKCLANIFVDYAEFTEEDGVGILSNIKERCKISHLLSSEVEVVYSVFKK